MPASTGLSPPLWTAAGEAVDHLEAITGNLRRLGDRLGGEPRIALDQAHLCTVVDRTSPRPRGPTTTQ